MTLRGRHADSRRQSGPGRARWWAWVSMSTILGLGIRIGTVLGRPHRVAGGDSYYYHNAANLLVSGKGFINPYLYYGHQHLTVPTASFPPGFVFVLAMASLVGLKSYFAHRIWCCVIGALAIPVCGLAGREIGGERAGIIATVLVAVYPNLWMSDELALSEALSPLLVALVLLAAYRFWKRPGWWPAVWLGAATGVAALARDELALLGVFIIVPLVLMARTTWRRRAALLVVASVAAVVIVGPWVGYNLSRFKDPVFISSGLGVTLASANCAATYSGTLEGYWDMQCALDAPLNLHADESVQGSEAESYALAYIRVHEDRLVPVELARIGRAFGFFRPLQQIRQDAAIETRPYHWALVGLAMYYVLFALSAGGVVILKRRGVPVFPLLAIGLSVLAAVVTAFGTTRYRSTFEVSLVLLAAVELSWIWDRLHRGSGDGLAAADPDTTAAEADARPDGRGATYAGLPVPSR